MLQSYWLLATTKVGMHETITEPKPTIMYHVHIFGSNIVLRKHMLIPNVWVWYIVVVLGIPTLHSLCPIMIVLPARVFIPKMFLRHKTLGARTIIWGRREYHLSRDSSL